MSQMIEKYHAAIVDCCILEEEFDLFMKASDIDAARGCLKELSALTSKWTCNLLGLRRVLAERGAGHFIGTIDYYLDAFESFNQSGLERLRTLMKVEGSQ